MASERCTEPEMTWVSLPGKAATGPPVIAGECLWALDEVLSVRKA